MEIFSSCFICVQLFVILWTGACWAPLSMGFSMGSIHGKYTGVGRHALLQVIFQTPFEPMSSVSPALQVDSLPLSHWGSPLIFNIFTSKFT